MNRMLSKVRFDGLPKDTNLGLQSPEQIIAHLKKYGDFVGIEMPEPDVQTTELTISEGYLTKAQKEYYDFINKSILVINEKSPIDLRESTKLEYKSVKYDKSKKIEERSQKRSSKIESNAKKPKEDKGEINQ